MNRLETIKQKAKLIIGDEITFLIGDTMYSGVIKEMNIQIKEDLCPFIYYRVSVNPEAALFTVFQDQII